MGRMPRHWQSGQWRNFHCWTKDVGGRLKVKLQFILLEGDTQLSTKKCQRLRCWFRQESRSEIGSVRCRHRDESFWEQWRRWLKAQIRGLRLGSKRNQLGTSLLHVSGRKFCLQEVYMEFKRGYLGLKESACVSELILSSPWRGLKKLNDASEEDWCSEWRPCLSRKPRKQASRAPSWYK